MWPTREQQFILNFLRLSLGRESPENTIRILSEEIDWDRVAVLAEYHGISPILYDSLQRNTSTLTETDPFVLIETDPLYARLVVR